jgi:hypothetical protein
MIKTTMGDKFVTFAMVFVTPGQDVLQAAADLADDLLPESKGMQHVQPMVQMQILDKDMNILETAILDSKSLTHFLVSGKAVGKEAVKMGDLVDTHFDAYREKAKQEAVKPESQ